MVEVLPHQLRQPQISYARAKLAPDVLDGEKGSRGLGGWNLKKSQFFKAVQNKRWAVIELLRIRNDRTTSTELGNFAKAFEKDLSKYGITSCSQAKLGNSVTPNYDLHQILLTSEIADIHNIESKVGSLVRNANDRRRVAIDCVIVLLPDKDASTYAMVKRLFDQKLGLHSICHVVGYYEKWVNNQKIEYFGPMYDGNFLANLYMKFNLKCGSNTGSANQVLQNKGPLLDNTTMIMGMDVVSN